MKFKIDFIQRRMLVEKQKILGVLIISIIIIGVLVIMALYENYRGYLFGLKNIDTQEKIEKFYNSNLNNATLYFNNIVDLNEEIVIESTKETQMVIVGQYGGFAGNPTETKNYTKYQLYKIEGDDYAIILCRDTKKSNIDFSKNSIEIINQYQKDKINNQIIDEYSDKKPTYVFYIKEYSKADLNWLLSIEFILIAILIIMIYSKSVHKRSKLAKNIKQFGKYEENVIELNKQVENAIYKAENVVICNDYILLLYKNSTEVIKMDNIESIKYIANEKYPDEVFTIEFMINNSSYSFDVYDKNIKDKIIDHIEKKQESKKEKPILAKDIPVAAEWIKKCLNQTGYKVDYDLESMKEVERFFCEQTTEGGRLIPGKCGSIIFGLGCLIGETIIRTYGGQWETNDDDPEGEINIAIKLPDNSTIWPVQKCLKRLLNGPEDNIFDYVYIMTMEQ